LPLPFNVNIECLRETGKRIMMGRLTDIFPLVHLLVILT